MLCEAYTGLFLLLSERIIDSSPQFVEFVQG